VRISWINRPINDKQKSIRLLKEVLKTVSIAAVSGEEIYRAIELDWNDFEDAVQYTAGEQIHADYIITRDTDGYINSSIRVINPRDFLDVIKNC